MTKLGEMKKEREGKEKRGGGPLFPALFLRAIRVTYPLNNYKKLPRMRNSAHLDAA